MFGDCVSCRSYFLLFFSCLSFSKYFLKDLNNFQSFLLSFNLLIFIHRVKTHLFINILKFTKTTLSWNLGKHICCQLKQLTLFLLCNHVLFWSEILLLISSKECTFVLNKFFNNVLMFIFWYLRSFKFKHLLWRMSYEVNLLDQVWVKRINS